MGLTIGTFNVRNLYSRYDFSGEKDAIADGDLCIDITTTYRFDKEHRYMMRAYDGTLVRAKEEVETQRIAERILQINVDVLAVQEVEDVATLRWFNRDRLKSQYPHSVLVHGNDDRLIDLGLLSKYPIGGVSSWQRTVHPDDPGLLIFDRDLLEVEILDHARSQRLFTLFNNHLRGHNLHGEEDEDLGQMINHQRRRRQAMMIAGIVKERNRPDSRYAILGDMNDPPDSQALFPLVGDPEMGLNDALARVQEAGPPVGEDPTPPSSAWTYRRKTTGGAAGYYLYDQVWLSPKLAERQIGAWIDHREQSCGDGTYHDPAWVEVEI